MLRTLLYFLLLLSPIYGVDTLTVAKNFLLFKGSDKSIESSEELSKNGDVVANLYYLSGGGYVVVPTTQSASPIKAYSFHSAKLNSYYQDFLTNHLYEFQNSVSNSGGSDRIIARWDFLQSFNPDNIVAEAYTAGETLLDTRWNQNYPYNKFYPEVDGENTLAGCVQTAVGQVMKYWNFPERGTGSKTSEITIKDGSDNFVRKDMLTAVFDRHYNWEIMDLNYSGGTAEYQDDEVGYLMRDLGIVNEAEMGISGTGAIIQNILKVLPQYFHYSSDIAITDSTDPEFSNKIRSEVDAERPVLFSLPGHLTVVDGYTNDSSGNYLHINMGWGGSDNDFYNIDENINAGGYSFNTANTLHIIYNVKPCNDSNGDCFINLENGDSYNGSDNIVGVSSDINDSDIYQVVLKGDTTISRQNNYYFISVYDRNGTLLDSNATGGISLTGLPLDEYTIKTSHKADAGTYYPSMVDTPIEYNLTIVTGTVTDAELEELTDSLNVLPEIAMELPHRVVSGEEKILLNVFDENGDDVNLSVQSSSSDVEFNLTKNILTLSPLNSDRSSTITVTVDSNGDSVSKSFTVLTTENPIAFGREFSISGNFVDQNTVIKSRAILDDNCSITGDMGFSNTQGFYKGVLDTSTEARLIDRTIDTAYTTSLTEAGIYLIDSSLNEGGGSYYPFDENRTGFRLDVQCPNFDDNISNIANILGITLQQGEAESNDTVELPTEINLEAGWSLISTPYESDTNLTEANLTGAYSFGFENGEWILWSSFQVSDEYQRFDTLQPHKGYWINTPSATDLPLTGDTSAGCPDVANLGAGWHLVGSCSATPSELVALNSEIYIVYSFKGGEWSAYSPIYEMNTLIQSSMDTINDITPIDGFWILIK
jgi:hypothetical protein